MERSTDRLIFEACLDLSGRNHYVINWVIIEKKFSKNGLHLLIFDRRN